MEHKGIRVLMRAWDKVGAGRDLPVHLCIVGDGILREEVEKWASGKNNVKVYGRLEGNKLEEVYNNCDTLIFPSICLENNPTVIHEAHQHGLRVIASNTGGVSEIIGEDDILVTPNDADSLLAEILKFV